MKLLLTIVQDADASRLQGLLIEHGYQSTKLASTGGFLREGNTTLIIGVESAEVETVKELIHNTCRQRTRVVPAVNPVYAPEGYFTGQAMEVPVGGAIVFVLGVEEFVRL